MRRVYNGTHRHISPKHLHLYVTEDAERLNIKDMHTLDKMATVVRNMVGKILTYKQLIAKNTLYGVWQRLAARMWQRPELRSS